MTPAQPAKLPVPAAPKRRGRPPAGERAMTNAERQRAYRKRQAAERFEYEPRDMSRVTLIDQLSQACLYLERPDYAYADGARAVAEGLLAELVRRYGLDAKRVRSAPNTRA